MRVLHKLGLVALRGRHEVVGVGDSFDDVVIVGGHSVRDVLVGNNDCSDWITVLVTE